MEAKEANFRAVLKTERGTQTLTDITEDTQD
jgi:hypothetical protein